MLKQYKSICLIMMILQSDVLVRILLIYWTFVTIKILFFFMCFTTLVVQKWSYVTQWIELSLVYLVLWSFSLHGGPVLLLRYSIDSIVTRMKDYLVLKNIRGTVKVLDVELQNIVQNVSIRMYGLTKPNVHFEK